MHLAGCVGPVVRPGMNPTTITIHGFAPSTYVRTVRMACVEKGLGHELAPLEFRAASHRALHPFARMPALTSGEVHLWETLAILAWLDDHPDARGDAPRLLPSEPLARATTLQWVSAANDYVYADLVHELGGEGEAKGLRERLREGLEVFARGLGARPYFGGAEPSAADLVLCPMLAHAEAKQLDDPPWVGLEALAAWSRRMQDRPSFDATR